MRPSRPTNRWKPGKSTLLRSPSASSSRSCVPPSPHFQPASGRHPRQAELLARQHLLRNPAPEHEDDGLQRHAVTSPGPSGLLLRLRCWQQRSHSLPGGLGDEFAGHAPEGEHAQPKRPAQPILSLGAVSTTAVDRPSRGTSCGSLPAGKLDVLGT